MAGTRAAAEASVLAGNPRVPFVGKPAALTYFTAIAEAWEMLEGRTDAIIARVERLLA